MGAPLGCVNVLAPPFPPVTPSRASPPWCQSRTCAGCPVPCVSPSPGDCAGTAQGCRSRPPGHRAAAPLPLGEPTEVERGREGLAARGVSRLRVPCTLTPGRVCGRPGRDTRSPTGKVPAGRRPRTQTAGRLQPHASERTVRPRRVMTVGLERNNTREVVGRQNG